MKFKGTLVLKNKKTKTCSHVSRLWPWSFRTSKMAANPLGKRMVKIQHVSTSVKNKWTCSPGCESWHKARSLHIRPIVLDFWVKSQSPHCIGGKISNCSYFHEIRVKVLSCFRKRIVCGVWDAYDQKSKSTLPFWTSLCFSIFVAVYLSNCTLDPTN